MSRFVVYGLDNKSQGEFRGTLACRWTVEGSLSISGDDSMLVDVPDSVATEPWLDLGRQVVAYPDIDLLPCAGLIDTPWRATLPVGITIYTQAYLLSLRSPSIPEILQGDVYAIGAQIIERINAQDEMFVRLGVVSGDDITRQETLDTRSYWEQLRALVARAGKEAFLRPEEDSDGRLITYVDIKDRVGMDGGFLYHDGQANQTANIQVLDAQVDGKIINMLTGLGSQNTSQSRLRTEPQVNQASVDKLRLRSGSIQFQGVADQSTLLANTTNYLDFTAWPRIKIPFKILDVGDAFANARPGNDCMMHVGNIYLPGGRQGYRGPARLTALYYNEADRTVAALAEAPDVR